MRKYFWFFSKSLVLGFSYVLPFKRVITAANEKPVVIAGGAKLPIADSLKMVEDAMSAGASGISYGRNVFNADNIELYLSAVKDIIFHEKKYQDCLNQFVERI